MRRAAKHQEALRGDDDVAVPERRIVKDPVARGGGGAPGSITLGWMARRPCRAKAS
jgi:hypothetical protein